MAFVQPVAQFRLAEQRGRRQHPEMRIASLAALALVLLLGGAAPSSSVMAKRGVETRCTAGPFILFFARGSDASRASHQQILKNALDNDFTCGNARILIEGHIEAGERESLSITRTMPVRRYFLDHGVAARRIYIRGFGSTAPREHSGMPDELSANARVAIYWAPSDDL